MILDIRGWTKECDQAPNTCNKCMWYKSCLKIDPTPKKPDYAKIKLDNI